MKTTVIDAELTVIEQAIVTAMVSAIVKELRSETIPPNDERREPLAAAAVRDVAAAFSVSESLVAMFVRRGWLTPVRIPGVRATRFALEDVKALARQIQTGELNDERPERGLAERAGAGLETANRRDRGQRSTAA